MEGGVNVGRGSEVRSRGSEDKKVLAVPQFTRVPES